MSRNNFIDTRLEKSPEMLETFPSLKTIYRIRRKGLSIKWLISVFAILVIILLLPWTQNIRAKGKITALSQQDRPQEINAMIPGRIVEWFVREGDYVEKGDTLVQLAEVKTEYLDPTLTDQVKKQIISKEQSAQAYQNKAVAAGEQVKALQEAARLKLASLDNKIEQQLLRISSDSAELAAERVAQAAYTRQIEAAEEMLKKGAISLVDFEKRKISFQSSKAKVNTSQNKLAQSQQELINLRIERNAVTQEYAEKIAKAQSDQFASISEASSTAAEIAKLENQLTSYITRQGFQYVLAPQRGQVTKARKAGIGEILKEGEMVVEVVPTATEKAVEMYIRPVDLPLISPGQKVRFVFDGFPALVFSGWPGSSYGTFGGRVVAIESSVSPEGLFKVLVTPDPADRKWPDALRMGGGAKGIALLKDVPMYYELWRNINGFPPEYYQFSNHEKKVTN